MVWITKHSNYRLGYSATTSFWFIRNLIIEEYLYSPAWRTTGSSRWCDIVIYVLSNNIHTNLQSSVKKATLWLFNEVCLWLCGRYFQLSTKSFIRVDIQTAKIGLLLPHILNCSWPSATSCKQQLTFLYLGPINTQSVLYMLALLAIFHCYTLLLPFAIFKRIFFLNHYISNWYHAVLIH